MGTGSALALVLAARRQQTTEHDLATKRAELRLREQADRHDTTERRINGLYTKARRPRPIAGTRSAADGAVPARAAARAGRRRRPVWAGIELELSGAVHIDFPGPTAASATTPASPARASPRTTGPTRCGSPAPPGWTAPLSEATRFTRATSKGSTRFENAQFRGEARFEATEFAGATAPRSARFAHNARFDNALFTGTTPVRRRPFPRSANFNRAGFVVAPVFDEDVAVQSAYFGPTSFTREVQGAGVVRTVIVRQLHGVRRRRVRR